MKSIILLTVLSFIVCVSSLSYFFGDMSDKLKLVHTEKVILQTVPLKKRIKTVEYKGPSNLIIKAIRCYDLKNGDGSVNITAGGIGTNHFTLRIKSQRSQKLDFEIEVYN